MRGAIPDCLQQLHNLAAWRLLVVRHQPFYEFEVMPLLGLCAGASLKLTILNPKGRVWTMVAGGGASVIYTDTVGDLGYAQVMLHAHECPNLR